jgi:hypothetical protein
MYCLISLREAFCSISNVLLYNPVTRLINIIDHSTTAVPSTLLPFDMKAIDAEMYYQIYRILCKLKCGFLMSYTAEKKIVNLTKGMFGCYRMTSRVDSWPDCFVNLNNHRQQERFLGLFRNN